jgi:hypothetical protein
MFGASFGINSASWTYERVKLKVPSLKFVEKTSTPSFRSTSTTMIFMLQESLPQAQIDGPTPLFL